MLTMAQGHHDHRRRRARVQNVNMPFGMRERRSTVDRRYPRGVRRLGQARGRVVARRRARDGRLIFVAVARSSDRVTEFDHDAVTLAVGQ